MPATLAIALVYRPETREVLTYRLETQTVPVDSQKAQRLQSYLEDFRADCVHIKLPGQADPFLKDSATTAVAVARRDLANMGLAHDAYGVEVLFRFHPVASIQDESASLLAALAFAADRADKQRCRALPPAYAATGRVTLAGQIQRVDQLGRKIEKACACNDLSAGSKIFYPQEQDDELTSNYPHVVDAARARAIRLCPAGTVEEALTWLLLDRPMFTAPHLGRLSRLSPLSHLEYALTVLTNFYQPWLVACLRAAVAAAVAAGSLATLSPNAVNQLYSLTPVGVLVLHYVYTLTLAKERAAAEDIVQTLNFPSAVIEQALTTLRTAEVLEPKGAQEGYRATAAGATVIAHYRAIRESTLIPALSLQPSDVQRVAEAAHVLHWLAVGYANAAAAVPAGNTHRTTNLQPGSPFSLCTGQV